MADDSKPMGIRKTLTWNPTAGGGNIHRLCQY